MIKKALLLGLVAAPGALLAQDNVTVQATATIVPALTLVQNQAMDFGRLVAPAAAAAGGGAGAAPAIRVTLPADGTARVFEGGVVTGGPGQQAANFTVTAAVGTHFSVAAIPAFDISRAGHPGTTMRVSVHEMRAATAAASVVMAGNRHQIPHAGTETFTLGSRLTMAAGQAPGIYTGNYTVTVAYN